jgi:hypothetical protein
MKDGDDTIEFSGGGSRAEILQFVGSLELLKTKLLKIIEDDENDTTFVTKRGE